MHYFTLQIPALRVTTPPAIPTDVRDHVEGALLLHVVINQGALSSSFVPANTSICASAGMPAYESEISGYSELVSCTCQCGQALELP
jgi:hypothetical protein